ncbi:aldose 1-epimerase family protein [Actinophytocola algeriensis]|uniref:Aldose 1-epimerase n=1 Tax=Actinophytocola algeriensis TaxID=1768010 RepID=A0A7W7VK64_9PSEU|nr:aldose 1-epimerase family protein [Actinophytocola algeriensis]MBB4912750.1 aldose 1-epimerase [Actinophytocola algeriensis]MBE1473582.1 aldose 1-epimerase [Actinophytocola algeriensis]
MAPLASGKQFEIGSGDQHAVIVEVGGGIREYTHRNRPVLDPYPPDAMADGAHGAPLIPWPNRIGHGQYRFGDTDYQLALTEPEKNNAIHGLLLWRPWEVADHRADEVTVGAHIHPMQGYPFHLEVTVRYALSADGLTVTTTATNTGDTTAPYGCGQHPYLSPGTGHIDDAHLQLDAATRIVTDPERQLPTGTEPVDGTPYDFRRPRPVGDLAIDYPFTDLARDDQGRARVRLQGTDGATAELWVDHTYPIIELFTGDTLVPDRRRRGLGVEPMTCPPDAFRTGDRLRHLEPGDTATTTWGARLSG